MLSRIPNFADWQNWYSRYLEKPVFRAQGEGETPDLQQSSLYRKWFRRGNVDHLGHVNRYVRMKSEEVLNSSFHHFLTDTKREIPKQYRMVFPNQQASFMSVSKYDKSQPTDLDEAAWELAGEWTIRHFRPYMGGSKVLDQEICVQEAEKQTSCGYPWNLKYKNKGEFFDDDNACRVLSDYWDSLNNDNAFVPIWTCSQKVELRDVDKLCLNKIRTFTASPVEHGVCCNRICLDMNNKFYNSNNKHWSYVGGNKFLGGWHALYSRLNRLPNAFELDESEYDSSLFSAAMFGMVDFRWEMLRAEDRTPENRRRLEHLYESIVHSIIVLESGELIQKHTGNPSGSANTIVDNTVILFRLFAYAWIVAAQARFGDSNRVSIENANAKDASQRDYNGSVFGGYSDFMEHVEAALNGDDNTFTVSDEVVVWFNPETISKIWTSVGVTTKTPSWAARKLHEVTFLSNGFTQVNGMWLPKPDTERVLCSLLYGGDCDDIRWHLLRASALRLDSWANVECRVVLQEYIDFINREFQDEMVGVCKNISMNSIREVWKSDAWLWKLYSGQESGSIMIAPDKTKFLTEIISCLNE